MIWRPLPELDEASRAVLEAWRCPRQSCGAPAERVGLPEIAILSPGVRGGELQAIDCRDGHRTIPGPVGNGVYDW